MVNRIKRISTPTKLRKYYEQGFRDALENVQLQLEEQDGYKYRLIVQHIRNYVKEKISMLEERQVQNGSKIS